jgi:hypothetical protein
VVKSIFIVFDTFWTAKHLPKSCTTQGLRERHRQGEVELVQKRTNGRDSPFEYTAIKRKDFRPPFVNGERWVPKIVGQNQRGHRF